jgi:hypothetical protein
MAKKKDIMSQIQSCCTVDNIKPYIIPEVAFFATLYYVQYLLQVQANLILSSVVLFVLINVAVFSCPLMKACCK